MALPGSTATSGFRPDYMHRMLERVFECEPPCIWNGHNKVLFKKLLGGPRSRMPTW